MSCQILVVEDEPKVLAALLEGLSSEGYKVRGTASGEEAYFLATTVHFDLILLDHLLPGRNGIEILTAIRARDLTTPVLMLTAVDSVSRRVAALNLGADDYLTKPFSFDELLARIAALLRRVQPMRVRAGDLELDVLARHVRRDGKLIELTDREFKILEYLVRRAGEVVLRDDILREVWKYPGDLLEQNNLISVHVSRLRRKIQAPGKPEMIETVRGIGFRLSVDEMAR